MASKGAKYRTKKPKPERDLGALRRCLMCGRDFDSHGPGNRRCKPCKDLVYHQGASLADETANVVKVNPKR